MNNFTKNLIISSLFLVLFIDGLGISITLPLFPDMFINPNTSILDRLSSDQYRNFIYGLSLVSFPLGMFFGSPILGQLSDKLGRKRVLIYSLLGTSIGYILSGIGIYIKLPSLFILGRIIDGLTAGSIPIAQAAICDISSEDKKVGNIGLILFAVTAGYILGPLISESLSKSNQIGNFSLYTPFYATAILSLINILLLLPLKTINYLNKTIEINLLSSFNTLGLLRKVEKAKVAIIAFLFFQLGWTIYFQYVPYFLTSCSQEEYIASILSIMGCGMALSFCVLTRIFQYKFTPINGSILTMLLIILSIIIQVFFQANTLILKISAFVSSLGYALGYSFLLTYLVQHVGKELQGLIMGFAASISALASVFTALLGSLVVSFAFQLTYLLSIIFFILCFLTLIVEKRGINA